MGHNISTVLARLMPLNDKINTIVSNKYPLYQKEVINQIIFIFLSTQFFFFILGFDSLISCIVYICEKNEKYLMPKIILPILDELYDKKFLEFLTKYKGYSQREKDEIIKASFDDNQIKYYEENPIGKKELQNLINNINNHESNLIIFYEKIIKIGFSILFPIFKDKPVENMIKTYEQFISIVNEEVMKLNNDEKKIVLECFLQVDGLKYTNFLQQIVIYSILFLTKGKGNHAEKKNILKVKNFNKLIEIMDKIKNNENEIKNLFEFNTKELNIEDLYKKNDIYISLFGKEIIEFNNNNILKYYEIIKQKEKYDYFTSYICEDFLEQEQLSLIKIDIKDIKKNEEAFSKFKKFVTKEIELRRFMYELNESSLKLYNYYLNENEFLIVNELYDCNLNDLLSFKKTLSLNEIKSLFRQINALLYILIVNNITNIGLKPENILLKYKDKSKKEYKIKLNFYILSHELANIIKHNNDIIFMAPELIKDKKNVYKSELFTIGVLLYFLFMGKYPFGNNSSEIISKFKTNNNEFYLEENIDKDLKDLLNKLLQFEPNNRINWDEYFLHDFFKIKFDEEGKII